MEPCNMCRGEGELVRHCMWRCPTWSEETFRRAEGKNHHYNGSPAAGAPFAKAISG